MADLLRSHGIGLTGGIATGKSTVGRMIAATGTPVYDADQLAREAIAPGSKGHAAVADRYPEVIAADGAVDRKALGTLVFNDPKIKSWLEATLHPVIGELLAERLIADGLVAKPRLWFYEAALLFETGRDKDFRKIWVTTCPEHVQLERIKSRNPHKFKALQKAIAAQMPTRDKAARADVVFDTDRPMAALKDEVLTQLRREQQLVQAPDPQS